MVPAAVVVVVVSVVKVDSGQARSSQRCRCTSCVGQGTPAPCAGCSTTRTRESDPTPQLTLHGPHASQRQTQSAESSGGTRACSDWPNQATRRRPARSVSFAVACTAAEAQRTRTRSPWSIAVVCSHMTVTSDAVEFVVSSCAAVRMPSRRLAAVTFNGSPDSLMATLVRSSSVM